MWLTGNGRWNLFRKRQFTRFLLQIDPMVGSFSLHLSVTHVDRTIKFMQFHSQRERVCVYELQKKMLRWLRSMTRLKWLFYFGNNWSMTNYYNAQNERWINSANRFWPLLATKKKYLLHVTSYVLPCWSWMAANSGSKWKKIWCWECENRIGREYKPCVGTLVFWFVDRKPFATFPLLLFNGDVIPVAVTVFGMFAVDFVNNLVVVTPLLVRGGRCVVVIFVNVYGGKSFIISESIMRAMCWKLDEFCTLLHGRREKKRRNGERKLGQKTLQTRRIQSVVLHDYYDNFLYKNQPTISILIVILEFRFHQTERELDCLEKGERPKGALTKLG